ncbi:hypothetical protein PP175_27485 (plasmid) [Aneurinibacillus sp. Ricciae_BoGa-3]|nr:hypothetical protein [Aneurinibacillus sp. Ricciae_BoGa-3]WCK56936.1 hypothetical protein PP175_27485 [Aneurinibacillus sp. Ricciae_BoGa-3]
MKNVNFLGKKCVYFKHISHIVIDELDIFHHTAMDLEYGEKSENGEYNLLTEDQLAQIYLGKGKGVLYKGYIVFEADLIENNEHYDAFYSLYGWIKKNYEAYLNGVVFHSLKDKFQFNQVKSIIMLYQSGFF